MSGIMAKSITLTCPWMFKKSWTFLYWCALVCTMVFLGTGRVWHTRAQGFEGGAVIFVHPLVTVFQQQAYRCRRPIKLIYLKSLNHLPVPSCAQWNNVFAWVKHTYIYSTMDWNLNPASRMWQWKRRQSSRLRNSRAFKPPGPLQGV